MSDLLQVAVSAPRWAVELESIEKGEGEPFDNECNLSSAGEVRRPQRRKYPAELHKQRLTTQFNGHGTRTIWSRIESQSRRKFVALWIAAMIRVLPSGVTREKLPGTI